MHDQLIVSIFIVIICSRTLSKDLERDDQLLKLSGLWRESEKRLKTSNPLALALLDLMSKAFDVVSHAILLEKLKSYGVCGGVLSSLKSYLQIRRQVMWSRAVRASSSELPVNNGVCPKVPYYAHSTLSFTCQFSNLTL